MIKKNIENVVLFQIERTSRVSKLYSQRAFDQAELGITVEQWILLKIIEESVQLSQQELSRQSLRDPASITRTLDLLEKKQLIVRSAIPGNRRQYDIGLTSRGASFVKQHMKMITAHRRRSIRGFSREELAQLQTMLARIQKNMS